MEDISVLCSVSMVTRHGLPQLLHCAEWRGQVGSANYQHLDTCAQARGDTRITYHRSITAGIRAKPPITTPTYWGLVKAKYFCLFMAAAPAPSPLPSPPHRMPSPCLVLAYNANIQMEAAMCRARHRAIAYFRQQLHSNLSLSHTQLSE